MLNVWVWGISSQMEYSTGRKTGAIKSKKIQRKFQGQMNPIMLQVLRIELLWYIIKRRENQIMRDVNC